MTDTLSMWTVYDHPRDFPNSFVARRFVVNSIDAQPTNNVLIAPTLEELQLELARMGLFRIPRQPEDEAQIVESWI